MVSKLMKKQGTKPTPQIICLTRLDNRKCIRGKANMLDNTNESNFTTQMHKLLRYNHMGSRFLLTGAADNLC